LDYNRKDTEVIEKYFTMPIRLEDSGEMLEHAGHEVTTRAKRMWSGFADFALQDNVLEVAVGLM
jgi:large conductance mechanosensitive channel